MEANSVNHCNILAYNFTVFHHVMCCTLPRRIACVGERHVAYTKVVQNPENSQAVADTVAPFHTDQRSYAVLFMCLDYLWNRNSIKLLNLRE
jgi:hypothetical protein